MERHNIEEIFQLNTENAIQLFSGKPFWPLNPENGSFSIVDIAHALSNLCRYGGHTRRFYSVAEHCYHVSLSCSPENALWGLLHDAPEGLGLVDLPRPVKIAMGDFYKRYKEADEAILRTIARRYNLDYPIPREVHEIDNRILLNERCVVMHEPKFIWHNMDKLTPLPDVEIMGWSPDVAMLNFIERFNELIIIKLVEEAGIL